MSAADYVDGFLEGHEPAGTRTLYRFVVVSFVVLSLFCGIANLATLGKEGHRSADAVSSFAILGLTAIVLQNVRWYRQDNQDPKHKRWTMALMAMVLLLDVAACMSFHETMTYTPPTAVLPPPTPNPSNVTAFLEHYFDDHR